MKIESYNSRYQTCFLLGSTQLLISCAEYLISHNWEIKGILTHDPSVIYWSNKNSVIVYSSLEQLEQDNIFVDYLFSIIYDEILSQKLLLKTRYLNINYHDSFLPSYAGLNSTAWAILNNEGAHGITWHIIDKGIDRGEILFQEKIEVNSIFETSESLNIKCMAEAIKAFKNIIGEIETGSIKKSKQNVLNRSYYSRCKIPPCFGVIDWNNKALDINRLCRALNFGQHDNQFVSAKILINKQLYFVSEVLTTEEKSIASPGTISKITDEYVQVSSSDFDLKIKTVFNSNVDEIKLKNLLQKIGIEVYDRLLIQVNLSENIIKKIKVAKLHEKEYIKAFIDCSPPLLPNENRLNSEKKPCLVKEINFKKYNITLESIATAIFIFFYNSIYQKKISLDAYLGESQFDVEERLFFLNYIPITIDFKRHNKIHDIFSEVNKRVVSYKYNVLNDIFFRYKETLKIRKNKIALVNGNRIEELDNYSIIFHWDEVKKVLNIKLNKGSYDIFNSLSNGIESVLKYFHGNTNDFLSNVPIINESDHIKIMNDFSIGEKMDKKNDTIITLLYRQIKNNPNFKAVVMNYNSITYKELDKKSDHISSILKENKVIKGAAVALFLDKSIEFIYSIIGILKLGAMYIPIDSKNPIERVREICNDVGVRIIISEEKLVKKIESLDISVLIIDNSPKKIKISCSQNGSNIMTDDLAYIIYTSGSSGKPKGVCCTHNNIINLLDSFQSKKILRAGMSGTLLSSIGFDVSVYEIWSCLLYGLTLHIVSDDLIRDTKKLLKYFYNNRINSAYLPSYILKELVSFSKEKKLELIRLLVGVEPISNELLYNIKSNIKNVIVINGYGLTEATVCSTLYEVNNKNYKVAPIGKPINNTIAVVLNKEMKLTPIGFYGELYLGGSGLAKKYWNNPNENKKKFIKNPFDRKHNTRLFNTGDIVRFLEDGNIEFLGRKDFQIKIRGFRIEPREIEVKLNDFSGIKSSYVCVVNEKLVAYYIGNKIFKSIIKNRLKYYLPEYMIPTCFVQIQHLPVTIDGKIDRNSLPDPFATHLKNRKIIKPGNKIESILVEIWKKVLNIEEVGLEEDFFYLGGDSIKIIQLVSYANEHNISFSFLDILKEKTIKKLSKVIRIKKIKDIKNTLTVFSLLKEIDFKKIIKLSNIEDAYPLSKTQLSIIYYHKKSKSSLMYKTIVGLELSGKLNFNAIKNGLNSIIKNNPTLRTKFNLYEFSQPIQLVQKQVKLVFNYNNLSDKSSEECERFICIWWEDQINKKFDLSKPELIQFFLYKISEENYFLGIMYHHVILDGWSIAVLLSNLLFSSNIKFNTSQPKKTTPEVGMPEYIFSENKSEEEFQSKKFWVEYIENFNHETMPFIKMNTNLKKEKVLTKSLTLDKRIFEKLKEVSNEISIPLKSILLSVHLKIISTLMSKKDIISGIMTNGRRTLKGFDKAMGVFVSALPIRVNFKKKLSWLSLIKEIHKNEILIEKHSMYPLCNIIEGSKVDLLFDIVFNYIDFFILKEAEKNSDMKIKKIKIYDHINYPLLVTFEKCADYINVNFSYHINRIEERSISRIILYYQNSIENLILTISNDNEIDSDKLIPEFEYKDLIKIYNETNNLSVGIKSIPDLFKEKVLKNRNRIAIVSENGQLTYFELDKKSNELANYFLSKLDTHLDVISVCLQRNNNLIIVILAILKIGACYLPIEETLPLERKKFILKDSKSTLLVIDDSSSDIASIAGVNRIININNLPCFKKICNYKDKIKIYPNMPAYVIYTSGTTGFPKGVVQHHRTITNLVQAMDTRKDLHLNTSQFCSIAFDVHLQEIFYSLLNGYTLHIINENIKKNVFSLIDYIKKYNINEIFLPTKVFEIFIEACDDKPDNLNKIYISGEKLNASQKIESFLKNNPKIDVVNQYGPSETHVVTELYLKLSNLFSNLIGKPIFNTKIFILDSDHKLTPLGAKGEICVAGYGVSPGYLYNNQLTKNKFIKNPYYRLLENSGKIYSTLYKTGDIGKWNGDGTLEFIGRKDFQIKMRGYRINIAEIEAILVRYPGIDQCAVILYKTDNDKHLIAYYTSPKKNYNKELIKHLSKFLPEYMIPDRFIPIKKFPLTINGKIDRALLETQEIDKYDFKDFICPVFELERIISTIWCDVLGIKNISVNDNFFSLGAHSIKIMKAIIKIKQIVNVDVPIESVFKYSSVRDLCAFINYVLLNRATLDIPIIKNMNNKSIPISLIQERFWIIDKKFKGKSYHYNIPVTYHLIGNLDLKILEKAFRFLINRHDVLRSYFQEEGEFVCQKIMPCYEDFYPIEVEHLSSRKDCMNLVNHEVFNIFDLTKSPLFYVKLLSIKDTNEYFIFINQHHIITDGWSIQILLHELSILYKYLLHREDNPIKILSDLKINYKDYSKWQMELMSKGKFNRSIHYWKNKFKDIKPLLLQSKNPRKSVLSNNGSQYCFEFSNELMDKLKNFSYQNKTTLFMTLLSAFSIMLRQYTDQDDMVIGTAMSNRNLPHLDNIIGCFSNLVGLRINFNYVTYEDFLHQIKETCLEAYQHQETPFKVLVNELEIEDHINYTKIFQVMLLLQENVYEDGLFFNDVRIEKIMSSNGTSKLDLILSFHEAKHGYVGVFEYNTDLFDLEFIRQMSLCYKFILIKILKSPVGNKLLYYLNPSFIKEVY